MLSKIQKVAVSSPHTEASEVLVDNGFSQITYISTTQTNFFMHPSGGGVFYRMSDLEDYIFDHLLCEHKSGMNPFKLHSLTVSTKTEVRIIFPSLERAGNLQAYAESGVNPDIITSQEIKIKTEAYLEDKVQKKLAKYLCGKVNEVVESDVFLVKPQFFRDVSKYPGFLTIVII